MNQFELPLPEEDGLIIPSVGAWSQDKHHFLRRYLHAFTVAMKQKRWDSLHYIDLFAGAGIERIEEGDGRGGLDWGSPLIAARLPAPFQRLHFVELDRKKYEALCARLSKFSHCELPQVLCGDANEQVGQVVAAIPPGSLSVAFLDPYGLHLHFATLRKLASRRMDLIVFFPDHIDALRNWEALYEEDLSSNLDRVLDNAPWRERKRDLPPDRWAEMLTQLYIDRIKTLGYGHFAEERICRTDGRHLYKLIFCSKDSKGLDLWNKISRQTRTGQRGFDFGTP